MTEQNAFPKQRSEGCEISPKLINAENACLGHILKSLSALYRIKITAPFAQKLGEMSLDPIIGVQRLDSNCSSSVHLFENREEENLL